MATNHTENYHLNLWEPNDKFVRTEFNENTTKIDAAIKAVDTKADTKASITAMNTALAQKARVIVGQYQGNGKETQLIELGCRPKAVLVWLPGTFQYYSGLGELYGGVALDGGNNTQVVNITNTGFEAIMKNGICSNRGSVFFYIAFC